MVHVKPFVKRKVLYFEVFNETTLLTCSYFLLILSDSFMDSTTQNDVGWYMVAVTLFNIIVNYLNLLLSVFKKLCKKAKRKCAQRKKAAKA